MSERTRPGDVVAVESRISAIFDETLTYRGIPIETLFEHSTFEETVFLLWFGQPPSASDLAAFQRRISDVPPLSSAVQEFVTLAESSGVTRALEAGVLGIGIDRHDGDDALSNQLSLLTGIPNITAQLGRIASGLSETPEPHSGSIAERFLFALRGQPVDPDDARAFDRSLILTADHELNASTFAARVAASTGADLTSVVLAAIATQSGPLHGGAMLETGAMLAATNEADPSQEIDRRLASGQRLPGFGHSVYRKGDPRAVLFRRLVQDLAERSGDSSWLERADRLARLGSDRTGLAPNLDLYAAAFWSALGLPIALFPAVFAIGRVAGWIAHYREQTSDNRLIRPRARYVGPVNQPYVPISERGEWFTR